MGDALSRHTEQSATAKQYLLGKLSGDELARFEERYFKDDEFFEELEFEEDELVDAYLNGGLSRQEQESFEAVLRHSARLRERVAFGKMLLAATAPVVVTPAVSKPWWAGFGNLFARPARLATAAGAVVILLVMPFLTVQWMWQRRESQRLLAQRAQLEQQQHDLEQKIRDAESKAQNLNGRVEEQQQDLGKLTQELEAAKQKLAQLQRPLDQQVASITLLSSLSRSGGAQELTLKPSDTQVRLNLALDSDNYPRYRVSIKSADDRTPIRLSGLRPHGPASARILSLKFRSRTLPAGDYVVTVSGLSSDGSYERVADYGLRLIK